MSSLADGAATSSSPAREFTVISQKLEIEIDFVTQSFKGKTEILILPLSRELRVIRLNCRQCKITFLTVADKAATLKLSDPYARAKPHPSYNIHQHHLLRQKLELQLKLPPEEDLSIILPKSLQIKELDPFSTTAQDLAARTVKVSGDVIAETPATASASEIAAQFAPILIVMKFETKEVRDGLHFVGMQDGDTRYPHIYTRNSPFPGTACSIFPCVDDLTSRCPWEISIKTPRTLGDAFRPKASTTNNAVKTSKEPGSNSMLLDSRGANSSDIKEMNNIIGLSEREMAMELHVICSGDMEEAEILDPEDARLKTVVFATASPVSANQIGFAVGPFQAVELSNFREIDEDEKLGTQAIRVHSFCLPGRENEVRNTCMPLAKALDFFTTTYTAYPGGSYKLCFVDDLPTDTVVTAGFTICSTRLLFPEDIIAPLDTVTRKLIRALAEQYAGISLVPRDPNDAWVVSGMASFMTDVFMRRLCGNNEYRFQQKLAADKVHELDVDRPSLYALGPILHVDHSEADFLALKAGVVLFILDRRIIKSSGTSGVGRIIGRILTNSKAADSDSTMISTSQFQRMCEKMGHVKLDTFFNQWIMGAGCPTFFVTQRFNKKKLVVEMLIRQTQGERETITHDLDPSTFLRDMKEDNYEVYAGGIQPVFVGPMTIRIHEADGTPYEHIVDIKDATTKFEIPYNTKYKRLRRNRRQKERIAASTGQEPVPEAQDDVLLYCLGDVLQSQEEVAEWRLMDWSKEEEDKMGQESYEWIRMDADFEWICKMSIGMPAYMFVSQLQQDRDVVAQMETLQYMAASKGHRLISTILTRTIMDNRYFHGIRSMAIAGLSKCATDELDWIGLFHLEKVFQELFCVPGSPMTRANDFSDRTTFLLQCAIPKAIAKVKTNSNEAPIAVKRFFVDKLKFNDNTDNGFSDVHYVSTLMAGLAESLASPKDAGVDEDDEEEFAFRKTAVNEIERYRRIDEWASSYQNVYSITALECMKRLVQSGVIKPRMREFLQYTRPGNGDNLRLKAVDCIIELGHLKNNAIIKYLLHILSTDPSPYFREHAFRILGKGLGKLAMGEKKEDSVAPITNGLVVEQEGSTEARQAELARRQTIPGALASLKVQLDENEVLKQALWAAVTSPIITLGELSNFLEICAAIYDSKTSLMVTLRYPRYWRAYHVGRGVVRFVRSSRVRTAKFVPMKWIEPTIISPAPRPVPAAPPTTAVVKPLKVAFPKAAAVPKPPPAIKRKQSVPESDTVKPRLLVPANDFAPPATTITPLQTTAPSSVLKLSPSPAPERRIVKLKFKGPLPPETPAKRSSNKTAAVANGTSSQANGAGLLRLTTKQPTNGTLKSPSPAPPLPPPSAMAAKSGKKAMSPPPRPVPTASAPAHKQNRKSAPSQPQPLAQMQRAQGSSMVAPPPTTGVAAAAAPPPPSSSSSSSSKKRKNSTSSQAALAEAPAAKRPILKIRLSGFGGVSNAHGNGEGAAGSPGGP